MSLPTRPRAVDLFAGLGGFSCAARMAGCRVVAAVNHAQLAVKYHSLNHPEAAHGCYSLNADTDYQALPDCDLLLASPCCQGHSDARGKDSPQHDASRATALAVVAAMHAKRPAAVIVENVPEFRCWGLKRDGSRYRWWRQAFDLEYLVTEHVLDAADFGAGSHRVRLFITMVRRDLANGPVVVANPHLPPMPAGEVIDRHGYDHLLRPVADKCAKTRAKFARLAKKTAKWHEWAFCYRGKGYAYPLASPLFTITTIDQWAYVRGDLMRFLQPAELRRAMGFPDNYQLPTTPKRAAVKLLGNAVSPPVGAAVIRATLAACKK